MKRTLAGITAAVMMASLGVTGAFAAGNGFGAGFVDEDGDGVCDWYGSGRGMGAGFVDEDGDGVCDHGGVRPQDGTGMQRGLGRGRNSR